MKNTVFRCGDVVVHPLNTNQLIEWLTNTLKGRTFEVVAKEDQFGGEPFKYENCRLDDNAFPNVKFSPNKLTITFILDGPDDIIVPVGGFGKLIVSFIQNGIKIENKGIGVWEFTVLRNTSPKSG